MTTTKQDISNWFDQGVKEGGDYMIVVVDTFDYEDYPVFATANDFQKEKEKVLGADMQRIMEIYDLSLDKEKQLGESRAFHPPGEIDLTGEGSGTAFDCVVKPALESSTGVLEAMIIWEGQEVYRLSVKDGEVIHEEIEL